MPFTIAPESCFCSDGKTAIDYLVARGMQNLIDRFIDRGLGAILRQGWASPETQERFLCIIISDGKTLIDYLVADWNLPCMTQIMYYCSNRKDSQHSEEYALILQRLINARDKDGKTLMHAAAASGDHRTCMFLQTERIRRECPRQRWEFLCMMQWSLSTAETVSRM